MLILLVVTAVVGAAIWYFFIYNRSADPAVERNLKVDPEAQDQYDQVKHAEEEEEKKLTLEERIEMSWQFLTNITEMVMNRFSASDKQQVHEAGLAMQKNGMEYLHDVDMEIKRSISHSKSVKQTRKKKTGGRGR